MAREAQQQRSAAKQQTSKGLFRQTFQLWERTTAAYLQGLVRNPLFLTANSTWLNGALMGKKLADASMHGIISALGLPTRREQERSLHLLHQIEAKLDDLELRLTESPPQ